MKLAIFDCDGTLVDSQADICAAMESAFSAAGLVPPARHATRRVVGLSLHEAMRQLHPQGANAIHADLTQLYKDAFRARREAGAVAEPLYEGIASLIEQLAVENWQLAVATGKSDRGLAHCLAAHGLTRHFVSLQTADRHPSKPDPSMIEQCITDAGADRARTVMIGDTVYDIAMACNARVTGLGVDWGYHETHELIEAGATAVATSVSHLGDLLKAIA
jgi:phosphoglycolate phosphatase